MDRPVSRTKDKTLVITISELGLRMEEDDTWNSKIKKN